MRNLQNRLKKNLKKWCKQEEALKKVKGIKAQPAQTAASNLE